MSGLGEFDTMADAEDGTERSLGVFPNPPAAESPVIPLGFVGGKVVFAMPEGEIRTELAAKFPGRRVQWRVGDMPACLGDPELLTQLKVPDAATLCSPASGAVEAGRYLRMWPDLHGTDGFFAAVWQKT